MAKFGLGKGLDALLPLDEGPLPDTVPVSPGFTAEGAGGAAAETLSPGDIGLSLFWLPLDKLTANPYQPRKNFDEEKLQELADSIREHGVIEPLIVEDSGDGFYTIVAGERRSRAARLAGLSEAPALIRSYSDIKRMEVSLIENVQREDLNPVEEALAYRRLMDFTGLSQDEVAARVGKKRSTVANALRLLKLPQRMRDALETGALSPGHGRALLSILREEDQEGLFQAILAEAFTVRETERRAAALNGGAEGAQAPAVSKGQGIPKETPPKREPELISIEQQFIEALGTKVSITGGLARGSIHIDYYSMDDLDRLLGLLR